MELYTPARRGSNSPPKKRKYSDHRTKAEAIRAGSDVPVNGLLRWRLPPPEKKGKKRDEGELATLVLTFPNGTKHEYELEIVSVGGANYALSTSAQDIMIRIAASPVQRAVELKNHGDEVQLGRELAALGIGPAIFLDIRIREHGDKGAGVFLATAIERLHYSLSDVQKCPVLMRKMFIDADGESMLVDLYTRASRVVRCIDTKPSNVVVDLYDDGRPPRIALIDVDTAHCWRLESPRPTEGRKERLSEAPTERLSEALSEGRSLSPIETLDAYLHGLDMTGENIPLTPMLTTTLSLLVHVTVAAADYVDFKEDFGFPYPRITRVLLRRWGVVYQLVDQDDSTAEAADEAEKARDATLGVLPRLRDRTVRDEIRHYCGENAKKATNVICTWNNLDLFLSDMLELPASEILDVCRQASEPLLYEFLTTMLHPKTKTLPEGEYKKDKEEREAMGKKGRRHGHESGGRAERTERAERAERTERAEGLKQLLKKFAPKEDGFPAIPAMCNRPSCKYHRESRSLVYTNLDD